MSDKPKHVPVKIAMDHLGKGTIIIDGHDLSSCVEGFTLKAKAGDLTVLNVDVLSLRGAEVETEALVNVNVRHFYEAPQ